MTEAMRQYMGELCELMGLRDWKVILKEKPAARGNCGQIEVLYGQKRAYIRLSRDFDTYSPEKQRDTIVHELLHCHTHNIWDSFQRVEDHLAPAVFRVTNDMIVRDTEFAVDGIAGAWSRTLPLPPVEESEEIAA